MTTEDRVANLEGRVDRIEDDVWKKLDSMDDKLNKIAVSIARDHCPSPGKCLQLDTALGSAVLRIERLELQMIDIERWRFRMIGGLAVLITALMIFGPSLRAIMKLP